MLTSNNYKIIEIKNKSFSENNAKKLLNLLFSKYNQEDIRFRYNNESVKIFLNSLNLSNFRSDIYGLIRNNNFGKNNIFSDILEQIEKIKSYGIQGNKRVYVGYNQERKVKNRKLKIEKRLKNFGIKDIFKKENEQVSKNYENKIICGDSEEVLKKLPNNCVDLIFTSPPYNFGLDYSSTEDDKKWDAYFEKLFKVFRECIRVTKYGGRIIVNIQPLFSDYIPSHHIISKFFLDKGMLWKGEILWEKNNYNCKYTAWGSWKSPSNPYLKYTWEFLEIFSKGSFKKEGYNKNIDISADEFKKWVYAKWSIAPERKMKEYRHPAMFPEALVARVLKLFSYKKDLVLDPFNGVGTTTAVAKYLNRRYLGIDISKEYCNKAQKRISERLF